VTEQQRDDIIMLLALAKQRQGVWNAHAKFIERLRSMGADVSGMEPDKYKTVLAIYPPLIERVERMMGTA